MGIAEDQQRYANQAHGLSSGEANGYTSIGGGGGGGAISWASFVGSGSGGVGGTATQSAYGGASNLVSFPTLTTTCWESDFKRRMDNFSEWSNQMAAEQSAFASRFLLVVAFAVETVFLLAWAGL